jgi:hypothetical protein
MRGESDPLHKPTIRLRFVAVIAIKLGPGFVDRRNIGREMTLMIEAKHVRIFCVDSLQLKFRMSFPKRSKSGGETLGRARQFENDLLLGVRMPVKRVAWKFHSFFGRRGHDSGIVVTTCALRAGDQA